MLDVSLVDLKSELKLSFKKNILLRILSIFLMGIFSFGFANAQTSMVESVAPNLVFKPDCCVDAEYSSAAAAFSAAKAIWDQHNTLPNGIVVSQTALNFRPWRPDLNPSYNGVASVYTSDKEQCYDGQCNVTVSGGPGVTVSLRCPEDVVKDGGAEYKFGLSITGDGMSKNAACVRSIHIIPRTNQCVENPILPATGEKIQIETDYKSADGLLEFTRTYRSIKGLSSSLATKKLLDLYNPSFISMDCFTSWYSENTPLRKRMPTCFKYLRPLVQASNYRVLLESGEIIIFSGASNQLSLNHGVNYALTIYTNAQGKLEYELRTGKNNKDYFNDNGNLIRSINPSGMVRTYSYSTDATPAEVAPRAGLLLSQQDQHGRQLQFFYNSYAQLVKMKDPANKEYFYEYDDYNNLAAVTYPGGARRQYSYGEPSNINAGTSCGPVNNNYVRLLTGITDEKGIRFADYKYNCDARAVSTEHAGGADKATITYNADGSVTVKNKLNKNTIYRYTNIAGARLVSKVEGQPTANCAGANQDYTYTPEGWLASKTDWKGVKTTYTYNSLGQETSRTEAFGTTEAKTITTEWHSNLYLKTKETEPGRETIYSYDANGNLLSQTVNSLTNP